MNSDLEAELKKLMDVCSSFGDIAIVTNQQLTKQIMENNQPTTKPNDEECPSNGRFIDCPNWNQTRCMSPHHNPPSHLYIPEGKAYEHRCPACGKVSTVLGQNILLG